MKLIKKMHWMQPSTILMLLLVVMLFAVGCGKEANVQGEQVPTASATPTVVPEVTPTPREEPAAAPETAPVQTPEEEAVTVPETTSTPEIIPTEAEEPVFTAIELAKDKKRINFGRFDQKDQMNTYVEMVEYKPYYVGRTNYEESVDFIKKNKAPEDGLLYLGLPMYLPDKLISKVAYVEVDDPTVAKIENDELIGLKQGTFHLSTYDSEKNLIETKKYICTTFNDSKEEKESYMTILDKDSVFDFIDAWDIDYWKSSVHTIMDMSYLLQARYFTYDFSGEPKFCAIAYCTDEERWTWTANPETIFDMSKGVCIQVAQLAVHMLAGDYEDWGVVLIEGNQGHIFNWFFEDGYYYLFDFTEVISDNAWGKDGSTQYYDYWDYSDKVIKCETIDDIKRYCTTRKVDLEQNYAVYMYSCKGHDFLPGNINSGMSDSNATLNGEIDRIIIAFQDVVMEDLVVLYKNEKSAEIVWQALTQEEMNKMMPIGVYNQKEKYHHRHKY